VVVVDLRPEEVIHAGNRFMVYALYPAATVSIHVLWGKQRQNTVIAVGQVDPQPQLQRRHRRADAVLRRRRPRQRRHLPGPHDQADRVVEELVGHLNATTRTTV
jgi:hypothetical protein